MASLPVEKTTGNGGKRERLAHGSALVLENDIDIHGAEGEIIERLAQTSLPSTLHHALDTLAS